MKTVLASLAACIFVTACGGGSDSGEPCATAAVIVVTATAPNGAVTEYRFADGTMIGRAVEVQNGTPGDRVAVREESACTASP